MKQIRQRKIDEADKKLKQKQEEAEAESRTLTKLNLNEFYQSSDYKWFHKNNVLLSYDFGFFFGSLTKE